MKHLDTEAHDAELDALLADWRSEGEREVASALPSAIDRVLAHAPAPAPRSVPASGVVVPLPRRQRLLAGALLLAAAISGLFVGSSTGFLRDDDAEASDIASYDYGSTLGWTGSE